MQLALPGNARSSVSTRCLEVGPGRLRTVTPVLTPAGDPGAPSLGLAAGSHWAAVGPFYLGPETAPDLNEEDPVPRGQKYLKRCLC